MSRPKCCGRSAPRSPAKNSRPAAFRIERSQRIRANADAVFARVNDLREFNTWNPFAAADPSATIVYSGESRGPGAAYEWDSTGRAGKAA
jgi:hypothetical protein